MRIISGKLKGREIKGFDIEGTRPTTARVKESLMASIQGKIPDSVVLDLFAGSGNLGIEALSNGSSFCYFVDSNSKCIRVIKDNLSHLGILDDGAIWHCDFREALDRLKSERKKIDIIFIDPPYQDGLAMEAVLQIIKNDLLSNDGIIVLEYRDEKIILETEKLDLYKKKKYGDKWVSIYVKK